MPTVKRFALVPDELSKDTIEVLRLLTSEARSGKLIGIAFAAMYRGRTYIVDAAGEAYESPTFTLGMIDMLSAHMRKRIRKQL